MSTLPIDAMVELFTTSSEPITRKALLQTFLKDKEMMKKFWADTEMVDSVLGVFTATDMGKAKVMAFLASAAKATAAPPPETKKIPLANGANGWSKSDARDARDAQVSDSVPLRIAHHFPKPGEEPAKANSFVNTDPEGWMDTPEALRQKKKEEKLRKRREEKRIEAERQKQLDNCTGNEIPPFKAESMEFHSKAYGLARTLRSEAVIEALQNGWEYATVLRGSDEPDPERSDFEAYTYRTFKIESNDRNFHVLLRLKKDNGGSD